MKSKVHYRVEWGLSGKVSHVVLCTDNIGVLCTNILYPECTNCITLLWNYTVVLLALSFEQNRTKGDDKAHLVLFILKA